MRENIQSPFTVRNSGLNELDEDSDALSNLDRSSPGENKENQPPQSAICASKDKQAKERHHEAIDDENPNFKNTPLSGPSQPRNGSQSEANLGQSNRSEGSESPSDNLSCSSIPPETYGKSTDAEKVSIPSSPADARDDYETLPIQEIRSPSRYTKSASEYPSPPKRRRGQDGTVCWSTTVGYHGAAEEWESCAAETDQRGKMPTASSEYAPTPSSASVDFPLSNSDNNGCSNAQNSYGDSDSFSNSSGRSSLRDSPGLPSILDAEKQSDNSKECSSSGCISSADDTNIGGYSFTEDDENCGSNNATLSTYRNQTSEDIDAAYGVPLGSSSYSNSGRCQHLEYPITLQASQSIASRSTLDRCHVLDERITPQATREVGSRSTAEQRQSPGDITNQQARQNIVKENMLQQVLQEDGIAIVDGSGAVLRRDGAGIVPKEEAKGEALRVAVSLSAEQLNQCLMLLNPLTADVYIFTLMGTRPLEYDYSTGCPISIDIKSPSIQWRANHVELQIPKNSLPLSKNVGDFHFYLLVKFRHPSGVSRKSCPFKVYSKLPDDTKKVRQSQDEKRIVPGKARFQCSCCLGKEKKCSLPSKSDIGCVTCGHGKPTLPPATEEPSRMKPLPCRISQEWMEAVETDEGIQKKNKRLHVMIDIPACDAPNLTEEESLTNHVTVHIVRDGHPNECIYFYNDDDKSVLKESPRLEDAEVEILNAQSNSENVQSNSESVPRRLHLYLSRKGTHGSGKWLPLSKKHGNTPFRLVVHLTRKRKTFKSNRFVTTSSGEDVYLKHHLLETAEELKVLRYFLRYHGKGHIMPADIESNLIDFKRGDNVKSSQQRLTDFPLDDLSSH